MGPEKGGEVPAICTVRELTLRLAELVPTERYRLTGPPAPVNSSAPMSQLPERVSASMSFVNEPDRLVAALMASAPAFRWRSSEPTTSETNWLAGSLLISEPVPAAVPSSDRL